MLLIGICDDEQKDRFALRCLLERMMETKNIKHRLFEFSSGDGLLNWYEKHQDELELVFLDIEMNGTNGMDTAKKLREVNKDLQIVFVTSYKDYVFDGYSVGALGYLLKPLPLHDDRLEDVVSRALDVLHTNSNDVFVCQNNQGIYRIRKSTIQYFCSEKRQVTCVTGSQNYAFYAKLDDVGREIGPSFVRIHQRYLVNAMAVDKIEHSIACIKDKTFPISRNFYKQAMKALTQAMLP